MSYNSFKPYYNWNTFNTQIYVLYVNTYNMVLNLIITGIPSILKDQNMFTDNVSEVLNLIITGIPSIQGKLYLSLH